MSTDPLRYKTITNKRGEKKPVHIINEIAVGLYSLKGDILRKNRVRINVKCKNNKN